MLFGEALSQQFLREVLEAVAISVGAHQLARNFGTEDWPRRHAQVILDCRQIETSEMIELYAVFVCQNAGQIGRFIVASRGKAHKMLIARSIGYLDYAKPVAVGDETHGLCVDGQIAGALKHAIGQVFFVKMNCHMRQAITPH